MKREMSSFDIRSVATEMSALEGGHMDKIFQWGQSVLLRVNVQGQGKRDIFFKDGRWLYLPAAKPETPAAPQSFAMFLRKHIDNARVGKTRQVGSDRVVAMEVMKADREYSLVFEMFGGGNVLLVLDGRIENCLVHRTMRDRSVRPGEPYAAPKVRFDPFASPFSEFEEVLRSSKSDAVRTLAVGANLGGQYAEEVCLRAGADKSAPAESLDADAARRLFDAMRSIAAAVEGSPEPVVYSEGGAPADAAPIRLETCAGMEAERLPTMSAALDRLIGSREEAEERGRPDPEAERLLRRIERQEEAAAGYRADAEGLRRQADLLYENYAQASELLEVMKAQSARLGWDRLAEGAMKIPFVCAVDPSRSGVTAVFGGTRVALDYTKGIDANASDIYRRGKELGEKAGRAEEALAESRAALEKRMAGLEKERAAAASRARPTKQFWFERYKWFLTPSGRLAIAGRDAHTNDNVVKRHLKDEDVYAHADLHGAPSVVLKDGRNATEDELRLACQFALAQSKGWVAALTDGSAFWVYTDQVSKTPQAGEFVPRGAFIIRGRRNYEHHLPMELAVGEVEYQGERKVMCGPAAAMSELSGKYFLIRPGRGKAGRTAALMAKALDVPEEEVARVLPPGDAEIAGKVWPEEPERSGS